MTIKVMERANHADFFFIKIQVIFYHKYLYIFVKVSQVTIFYSSLDTFINTNTPTPKGGAPTQAEYTSKKERFNNSSD